MQMVPLLRAMHHQYPTAIEEEIELEDLDFASYTLEWLARVPAWRDFYLTLDQRAHYAYMKKVLQVLTFLRGPNRWVLKSPQHLEQIPALLATFPDATFAITHRDPVSVIQSAITMLAYGDRMRRAAIEPEALADVLDRSRRPAAARVRARPRPAARRPHRSTCCSTSSWPTTSRMVERIYARNGRPMTPAARPQLDAFMADNPRGKHGRLAYDLRGDFGLDPDAVRARFALLLRALPGARWRTHDRRRCASRSSAAARSRTGTSTRSTAPACRSTVTAAVDPVADERATRRRPHRRGAPTRRSPTRSPTGGFDAALIAVPHHLHEAGRDRGARRRAARAAREAARADARRVRPHPRRRATRRAPCSWSPRTRSTGPRC